MVVNCYVATARHFLASLAQRRVAVERASEDHISGFVEQQRRIYRRKHGHSPRDVANWQRSKTSGVRMLLRLAHGEWPPPCPPRDVQDSFRRQLRAEYTQWLSDARGLAADSIKLLGAQAAQFLEWLGERCIGDRLSEITVADINTYLAGRSPLLRRATRTGLASGLRSFLRYLYAHGRILHDLAPEVPKPSLYAFETIPSALSPSDIVTVLEATRRDRTPKGLRDYAILILLSNYGLRAGEITGLRLEDVNWRSERLHVRHSKTGAASVLPLLAPVGEAILDYLRHGRPACQQREIFLRVCAPYLPLRSGSSLHTCITSRLEQAGVSIRGKHGPHAFRHARAVSLLRAAVPVKVIGDVLGHRSASSTAVYLKLATDDLRAVGLEVPLEVRL